MIHTNFKLSLSLLLVALGAFAAAPAAAQIQFEDVSEAADIQYSGQSYGSSWGDFDGDGCIDLFVSNHAAVPALYRNRCDGTFEDVAENVILKSEHIYIYKAFGRPSIGDLHGSAWGDYDNDGDLDLLLSSGGAAKIRKKARGTTNRLYRNDGDHFTDVAAAAGLDDPGGSGRTPLWRDLDGDGRLDALLFQVAPLSVEAVFRMQNDEAFAGCAPTEDGRPIVPDDGHPLTDWRSVYATQLRMFQRDEENLLIFSSGQAPHRIWRHLGDCRFEELDLAQILENPDDMKGRQDSAIGDFSGDLRPDLFIVTQVLKQEAATAQGDLNFHLLVPANENVVLDVSLPGPMTLEVGPKARWRPNTIRLGKNGIQQTKVKFPLRSSDPEAEGVFEMTEDDQGLSIGYLPEKSIWRITARTKKNNLRLYLRFKDASTITSSLKELLLGSEEKIRIESSSLALNQKSLDLPDVLLLEDGDRLSDQSTAYGLSDIKTSCRSVAAGDFDNDMDLDVYIVCGEKLRNLPNRLYENRGQRFIDVTDTSGASGSMEGAGNNVSIADYDNDGFLDLFVDNGDVPAFTKGGPHQLFRNRGNDNHWVKLKLIGTDSNRDAYGARAFVTAGDVTQVRHKTGSMHRSVQNSQMLHFGLAKNDKIDSITVQWPNGRIEQFEASGVDRNYELRQGAGIKSDSGSDATSQIDLMLPRLKDQVDTPQTFTALLGPNIDPASLVWQVADAPICEAVAVCRHAFEGPGTYDIVVSAMTKEKQPVAARRTLTME